MSALRYGFVGLGNLGAALSRCLARGGFDVAVTDLDRARAETPLAAGATWAESPEAAAEGRDATPSSPACPRRRRPRRCSIGFCR